MIEIARIQAWALRCPVELPVETSFGVMADRPAVLVRIEDADGAFGWGEVFANWPAAGAEHRVALLDTDIAPLVLGKRFGAPDALFAELEKTTRIRAVQCGEVGPFAQVIAGLDTALWDLAARRAGLALRKMLRADAPDVVPAYGSGIHIKAAADVVPQERAGGHHRFKVKVGFDSDRDVAQLQEIACGLGAGEALACDANQAWDLEQAKAFADRTREIPLLWLEEPMAVFAPKDQWAALAAHAGVPLAGGENILGAPAFEAAVAQGHLGVIQPDVAKWGGITGCLSVARQALAAGRIYCPHFLGAGVGLAASGELLAAAGGAGLLEVDVNDNPLRQAFFGGAQRVERGAWRCSDKPGLGIETMPDDILGFVTAVLDLRACG